MTLRWHAFLKNKNGNGISSFFPDVIGVRPCVRFVLQFLATVEIRKFLCYTCLWVGHVFPTTTYAYQKNVFMVEKFFLRLVKNLIRMRFVIYHWNTTVVSFHNSTVFQESSCCTTTIQMCMFKTGLMGTSMSWCHFWVANSMSLSP